MGDQRTAELFAQHDRMARDLMAGHEGLEIDKADGFLVLFERPLQAVRYALAYHQGLARLARNSGIELAARVGIHLGEVVVRENTPQDVERGAKPLEVEGLAKAITSRMMSLAMARQTLLTRGAFEIARRSAVGWTIAERSVIWLDHGAYRLQGVQHPVRIFEVGLEGVAVLAPPPSSDKARRAPQEVTLVVPSGGAVGEPLASDVRAPFTAPDPRWAGPAPDPAPDGPMAQALATRVATAVVAETRRHKSGEMARARRTLIAAAVLNLLLLVVHFGYQERRIEQARMQAEIEAQRTAQTLATVNRLARLIEESLPRSAAAAAGGREESPRVTAPMPQAVAASFRRDRVAEIGRAAMVPVLAKTSTPPR